MSEQLYYTYSTIGSGSTTGERIRAQSPDVGSATSERVRSLMKYLTYRLPAGADLRTPAEVAPLSLVLARTQYNDRILSHKKCVDRDGIGRAGNFFTHAIIDPEVLSEQTGASEPISAHAAISLWKSPFWKTSEDQAPPKDTKIDSLSPQDIQKYMNITWEGRLSALSVQQSYPHCSTERQTAAEWLPLVFSAFLMLKKLNKKQLYIAAPADMVATLIWCITRCLPDTLTILPDTPTTLKELTFSTYEFEIAKSTTTITGTCWLPPANHSGPFTPQTDLPHSCYQDQPNLTINCYTQRQTPFAIDEQVSKFVQFATQSLLHNDMRQLDQLIEQAERSSYQNFEDLLVLLRFQQEEVTKDMVQHVLVNRPYWSFLQYTNIQDKLIELIYNLQDTHWHDWWETLGLQNIEKMYKWAWSQPQGKDALALRAFAERVMTELYRQLATDQQGSHEWAMYWDQLLNSIDNLVVWSKLPSHLAKLPYNNTYQYWWQQSGKKIAQRLYQMANRDAELATALNHWWKQCAKHLRRTWAQRQDTETGFWLDILSTIQPPREGDKDWNPLLNDLDKMLPPKTIPTNWCDWETYKALLITWYVALTPQDYLPMQWLLVDWKDLPQLLDIPGLSLGWKKFALAAQIRRFQTPTSAQPFLSHVARCSPLICEVLVERIQMSDEREQVMAFCQFLLQEGYTESNALLVSILPASFPYQGLTNRLLGVAKLTQEQFNDLCEEMLHNILMSQQDVPSWLLENYFNHFNVQSMNPDNGQIPHKKHGRTRDILKALSKGNQGVPDKLRPYVFCWNVISDFFSRPVFDPDNLRTIHDQIKAAELSEPMRQELRQEMLHFLSTHVETHVDILTVTATFDDLLLQAQPSDLPAHALLLTEMVRLQAKSSINDRKTGEYIKAVFSESIYLSESGIAQEKQTEFVDECLNSLLAAVETSHIQTARWHPTFSNLWESYLSRHTTASSTGTIQTTEPVSSPVQYYSDPANSTVYNQDNLSSPSSTVEHQQPSTLPDPSQGKPLPPRPTSQTVPANKTSQHWMPTPNKLKNFFGKRSSKQDSLDEMFRTFYRAIQSNRADKIAEAYNETLAKREMSQEYREIAIMCKELIDSYASYRKHITEENKAKFVQAYDTISKYSYRNIIIDQVMHKIVEKIRKQSKND